MYYQLKTEEKYATVTYKFRGETAAFWNGPIAHAKEMAAEAKRAGLRDVQIVHGLFVRSLK